MNDPGNTFDAPIPGFVGPDGIGKAREDDGFGGYINPRNYVNPLFFGWATGAQEYYRSDAQPQYNDPTLACGPVTGDTFDVVSLGDLSSTQIASSAPAGRLTVRFTDARHTQPIRNLPGADFVVFENGFLADSSTGGAGAGGIFADLGYVEVSSDGASFARFPSRSLTANSVGSYGSLDATNLCNLAGKHVNGFGDSWGTPFDLSALANDPLVSAGTVDLNNIRYVRIVDIPGSGAYADSMGHAIYDAWQTYGSGGVDVEAVGAISVPMSFDQWQDAQGLTDEQRGALADPDGDGAPNIIEYAFGMSPLRADAELLPKAENYGGVPTIRFRRDLRATGVQVEVLGTGDLHQPWQTLARSQLGADFQPAAPFSPMIVDGPDSPIASVGVLRRTRVSATPGLRFLRISVSLAP